MKALAYETFYDRKVGMVHAGEVFATTIADVKRLNGQGLCVPVEVEKAEAAQGEKASETPPTVAAK